MPAVHDSTHDNATKERGHIDHDEGQGSHGARCAESSSVGGEGDRGDEVAEALKNVAELKKEERFVSEEPQVKLPVLGGLRNGKARLEI